MKSLNENHVFELLSLTKVSNDAEYNEYLDSSLVKFIESQPYLKNPDHNEESSDEKDSSSSS